MQIFRRRGNGIFIHTSANFTTEEIEEHYNNPINPDARKDGSKWKAPKDLHRIKCGSNPQEVHVILTVNGEPFTDKDTMPDKEELIDRLEELMIALAIRAQAEKEGITGSALLKRIAKDYLISKGIEL